MDSIATIQHGTSAFVLKLSKSVITATVNLEASDS